MKGNIYANGKCPACGGKFKHDENQDGCFCRNCDFEAKKGFRVSYGEKIMLRFNMYVDARDFLNGLRWKDREGTLDPRDYKGNHPLGFETQATKWLAMKEKDCKSPNTYRNIKRDINKAMKNWGQTNIKNIGYSEIEDFLFGLAKVNGKPVSDKTRSNTKSVLHDFWRWLVKRERKNKTNLIEMPDFPDCGFVLAWRDIVDIDTQQAIINEVKRISFRINPKIWLGIKWLSTYITIRPGEMRLLKEKHIDVDGVFVIPTNKENYPKIVPMIEEDIKLYHKIHSEFLALPNVYFFRHIKGNGAANPGQQFGKDYFWKWWKKACENLGVEGVPLYPGTKHSTTTALGEYFSENELMDYGSFHKSNKAFRRYMQTKKNRSRKIYQTAYEIAQKKRQIIGIEKRENSE